MNVSEKGLGFTRCPLIDLQKPVNTKANPNDFGKHMGISLYFHPWQTLFALKRKGKGNTIQEEIFLKSHFRKCPSDLDI